MRWPFALAIAACTTPQPSASPSPSPSPPPSSVAIDADALCQQAFPCPAPIDPANLPFMCALPGKGMAERLPIPTDGTPIARIDCPFRKLGMSAVVGVGAGGTMLRGVDAVAHLRGSAKERANAIAQLLDAPLDEGACVPTDGGGVLRFCVANGGRCIVERAGSVACSADGADRPLRLCEREMGPGPWWVRERAVSRAKRDHVYNASDSDAMVRAPLVGAPSDSVHRDRFHRDLGAEAVELRARGLALREVECRRHSDDRPRTTFLGFDRAGGRTLFAAELLPRLDDATMQAALVLLTVVREVEPWAYLLLDPDAKPAHCALPASPASANGVLRFTVAELGRGRKECEVTTPPNGRDWSGTCREPPPGRYCSD